MNRAERQHLIKQLIREHEIRRQQDFVRLLNEQGYAVTQATVSRDIKAMELVKVPATHGGYRYSLPVERQMNVDKKLGYALKDAFVSLTRQGELLFLKTSPGSAPAISTLIYQMHFSELFGNIGDDDSIFIVSKSEAEAESLQKKLLNLIN
ncbi:arginine catabolic regulator [Agrilactobacillus composti DSM 18527 = JCM 14202]|uniref:Arginine repressor n=1 Tax=Agrilactobacillus composti DSM 18527 = JCM 14202 TaxID=1423734 RepID=A0A0R1Y9R7_9LACO|nr:ArgR family transcriptional regulator [Agrilactobacillus composti]KRM35852.1 arginine catabolic regulator [Agrilactobacillus composti DSM 18527 = JCM 14202]